MLQRSIHGPLWACFSPSASPDLRRHSAAASIPPPMNSLLIVAMLVAAPAMAAPGLPPTTTPVAAQTPKDGKLRIIAFGAHPDDCELKVAGAAAKWAAAGHLVKFVSVTNGDIGHSTMAGGPLANRRRAEVMNTAKLLGITAEVLDLHDGELMPTLENRRTITRLIREWRADVVLSHRPNDYHPDHRNVGLLIQDAGYMVTVPFFCPDVPHLVRNPVFMFYEDGFAKPNPFTPDVVVSIDDVIDKKLAAVEALESQFYEGGANGSAANLPAGAGEKAARKKTVRDNFARRFSTSADRFRSTIVERYGAAKGSGVKSAEAFEICEYGRRPDKAELQKLFPF